MTMMSFKLRVVVVVMQIGNFIRTCILTVVQL